MAGAPHRASRDCAGNCSSSSSLDGIGAGAGSALPNPSLPLCGGDQDAAPGVKLGAGVNPLALALNDAIVASSRRTLRQQRTVTSPRTLVTCWLGDAGSRTAQPPADAAGALLVRPCGGVAGPRVRQGVFLVHYGCGGSLLTSVLRTCFSGADGACWARPSSNRHRESNHGPATVLCSHLHFRRASRATACRLRAKHLSTAAPRQPSRCSVMTHVTCAVVHLHKLQVRLRNAFLRMCTHQTQTPLQIFFELTTTAVLDLLLLLF